MLRKIKTNLKSLQKKEASLMDYVLDLDSNIRVKNTSNLTKSDQRKVQRGNERYPLRIRCDQFNGNFRSEEKLQTRKKFSEDKENKEEKNRNLDGMHNSSIKKYFKPLSECKKAKKIEFYDELNKKFIKMTLWEEKDIEFTKSKVMPQVKMMKVDNDVMTDDEQLGDAFKMMRENLKETIKLINENKDYLAKNLSRKIKLEK